MSTQTDDASQASQQAQGAHAHTICTLAPAADASRIPPLHLNLQQMHHAHHLHTQLQQVHCTHAHTTHTLAPVADAVAAAATETKLAAHAAAAAAVVQKLDAVGAAVGAGILGGDQADGGHHLSGLAAGSSVAAGSGQQQGGAAGHWQAQSIMGHRGGRVQHPVGGWTRMAGRQVWLRGAVAFLSPVCLANGRRNSTRCAWDAAAICTHALMRPPFRVVDAVRPLAQELPNACCRTVLPSST
eukprot:704874-Pelagomonas_calceolata.AAC.4